MGGREQVSAAAWHRAVGTRSSSYLGKRRETDLLARDFLFIVSQRWVPQKHGEDTDGPGWLCYGSYFISVDFSTS